MVKRLLGTATTDSSGVATLNYTGTGKGKIQLIAETNDGSLSSTAYEIIDSYFYDDGGTGSTANWYNSSPDVLTVTKESDGTLLSSTGACNYFSNSTNTTNRYLENAWCVEFDVVTYTGTPYIRLYGSSSQWSNLSFENRGITNGSHIKFTYNDLTNSVLWEVDDLTPFYYIIQTDLSSLQLGLSFRFGDVGTLKFKNYKVYSV